MATTAGYTQAEYVRGYELGMGIRSFDGAIRGQAIQGEISRMPGASTTPRITLATTQQELFKSLGISTEVSASYGLASVSAKMSFAQSFTSSQFSSWIVVRVAVTDISTRLNYEKNDHLLTEAKLVLERQGALSFFQEYGDLCVVMQDSGAEFVGVLQISSTSAESKQKVETSMNANFKGVLGADAAGKIESVIDSTESKSSKTFTCNAWGGPIELPQELTIEELVKFALHFPSTVNEKNARAVRVYLQDYRAIGLQDKTSHLSSPEIDKARTFLESINGYVQSLQAASGTIQGILDHPERYSDTLALLTKRYKPSLDAMQVQIAAFQQAANRCIRAFTQEDSPDVPEVPLAPKIEPAEPPLNPDPAFTIVSALGSSPRLVIARDERRGVPQVVLHPYDDSDLSQRWIFKGVGDRKFQLIAGDTKRPISSRIDPSQSRLQLVGDDQVDTAASWTVPLLGAGGTCTISSDSPNGAFEVLDGNAQVNTPICLAVESDAARQHWAFLPVGTHPPEAHATGISWNSGWTGSDTSAPPAIVAFNGLFHVFFRDATGNAIYHITSPDGANWSGATPFNIGFDTSSGPCPIVFEERLHIFFRDATGNAIYHVVSSDGWSFTPERKIGPNCDGEPSAAVLNDTLCVVAHDHPGNGVMYAVGKAMP